VQARSGAGKAGFYDLDGYRVLATTVWVPSSGTRYRVVSNESLEPMKSQMRTVGELLLITVPLCLALAAVGGFFLARKSLFPILEMAQTAELISSHNLEQRLAVRNPNDELGRLAETFNRVFERLQQAFRQQRQFMADASHELRTPVSVALTATQVSLAHRNHRPEELYDTLEVVQSQMLRLRRVVEDMFMLAQADSGVYHLTRSGFYLEEAVLESIRAGRVLGRNRGVEIRVGELQTEAACEGDEGLMRQLLLILIDNAVKYTEPGGHVEVGMVRRGAHYRICVADTGSGVAAVDRPYIFDRFYRADKSRSRRQPAAGSGAGLGLAIAQWIAQLHQGKVWLEETGERGSVFCVEVPAAAEQPALAEPVTPVPDVRSE
jgi:heavy metal sensor kinase